jgi:uncharacterized RDD family membrane protein YckC
MAKLIINPMSPTKRETVLPRAHMSIGRDPTNDLVLPDAMVSRRHAIVEYRGQRYMIRDCNSSNGSLVNGDRVLERVLQDGDLVAIGTARLLFRDDAVALDSSGKVLRHPSSHRAECSECGQAFRAGDTFCRQCGHQLEAAPPRHACSACGGAVRLPAHFCHSCGEILSGTVDASEVDPSAETALPGSSAAVRRGRSLADAPSPALVDRALAGLIDIGLVGLAQAVLLVPLFWTWSGSARDDVGFVSVLLTMLALLATFAGGMGYLIFFWGTKGATPGKRFFGLRVESVDGVYPIGIPRATVRALGYLVSGLFGGVGFLMIALDGDGLHDRIAGTRVVQKSRS